MIGYRSAEVHKQIIPENYKGTRSPSQTLSMQMQEWVLLACLLPFIKSFFYLCSYATLTMDLPLLILPSFLCSFDSISISFPLNPDQEQAITNVQINDIFSLKCRYYGPKRDI